MAKLQEQDYKEIIAKLTNELALEEQKRIASTTEKAHLANAVGHMRLSMEECITFVSQFPAMLNQIEGDPAMREKRISEISRLRTYLLNGRANMELVLAGKESVEDESPRSNPRKRRKQRRSKKEPVST